MTRLILFDVDGTLTESRKKVTPEMLQVLDDLYKRDDIDIGIVGGSDLEKQKEQLGDNIFELFDWVFSENGLMAFNRGQLIHQQSIIKEIGDDKLNKFVDFCLRYIADLKIPKKRGTFIEFRNGMINICPVGRNCSQEERMEFFAYDDEHKVRENMVKALEQEFPDYNLKFSIGGQISIDVFPNGWDKTYCLEHIKNENYDQIYFFGDKTDIGGNDYEIYTHTDTIGYHVDTYYDTIKYLEELF
jgi:phosphomannomutase